MTRPLTTLAIGCSVPKNGCGDPICLDGCKGIDNCPATPPPDPLDVALCKARLRKHVYRCARCNDTYGLDFSCKCGAELTYWGGEPAPVGEDWETEKWGPL